MRYFVQYFPESIGNCGAVSVQAGNIAAHLLIVGGSKIHINISHVLTSKACEYCFQVESKESHNQPVK